VQCHLQVPSSPLLAAALPALLAALTGACQQGGDAALAKRLHALLMLFTKGQAHSAPFASGASSAVLVALLQHLLGCLLILRCTHCC